MAAPITINTPVTYADALPDAVDVIIIGGGVIGIFSALYLNRLGKRVLVCEKGRIAGEQSSRNWGWIRQHGRDAAEIPITAQAVKLWHEIDAETGGACGVKTTGIAYLADNEKRMHKLLEWLDIAKEHDLDSYAMGAEHVDSMFSQPHEGKWIGGTCTPSDCVAEPWQAVPAVAKLAHQEGVLIRENCAVRDIQRQAGAVSGVVTEAGEVACNQVVLCGGAWSSVFARRLGIKLPQLTVEATVAQTQPLGAGIGHSFSDGEIAMRKRADGGYNIALADSHGIYLGPDSFRHALPFFPLLKTSWNELQIKGLSPKGFSDAWGLKRNWSADEITPFEQMRVMDPPSNDRRVARMQQRFTERFPQQVGLDILSSWSGMIDAMPDVVPVVDEVQQIPGFYLATGMSAHGFGIGPGYGRVIGRMLSGLPAEQDLTRCRLSRFSDGSKIEVGPAL